MRTLIHCQHSLGMGHLVRSMQIAEALLPEGPVAMLCGGSIPSSWLPPTKVSLHPLTPLRMDATSALVTTDGVPAGERVFVERCAQIAEVLDTFRPDVLIVEMFPFGRKKLAGEILSLIERARSAGPIEIVCSVRDVLVTTRRDQRRFDTIAVERLEQHFDRLMIHSDPRLISLSATLSTFDAIRVPCHYTGYISRARPARPTAPRRRVVVSAGGGRVGQRLLDVAADAADAFKHELGLDTVLLAGPLAHHRVPHGRTGRQPRDWLQTRPFVPDLSATLADSTLSISQCGYNTATDVLAASVPAVFVPFETPRENEQLMRARLLRDGGYSALLRERELSPATLLDAARTALALPFQAEPVCLDGLINLRRLLVGGAAHA